MSQAGAGWWLLPAAALAAAAAGTALVRRYALRQGVLDLPGARSAHSRPTPRGGGLAMAVVFTAGLTLLYLDGRLPGPLFWALSGGGAAIALVGFWDDHRGLPAAPRFAVHLGAVVWAMAWLAGPGAVSGAPPELAFLGPAGVALTALALLWLINLYNFMDGIDGLAASEAVFVALAALALLAGGPGGGLGQALALLAACGCGFLLLNWAPARIFMGDAGSCWLGYVFGVLALATAHEGQLSLWCWPVLLGVFVADASATLLRRVCGGARWYQAHRSHAYQHTARRLGHARTALLAAALNLLWLAPLAGLAAASPGLAPALTLLALAPLFVLALAQGAGREG